MDSHQISPWVLSKLYVFLSETLQISHHKSRFSKRILIYPTVSSESYHDFHQKLSVLSPETVFHQKPFRIRILNLQKDFIRNLSENLSENFQGLIRILLQDFHYDPFKIIIDIVQGFPQASSQYYCYNILQLTISSQQL